MYYLAEDADLIGKVELKKDAGIWYHTVLRGDHDWIRVGEGTNIQDGCIVHEEVGIPVEIGAYVTVGHGAILHGCTIGNGTLIGMGAIVLNGAKIGENCMIGAGALVTQGMVIPDGMLAFGSPAKVIRPLRPEEITSNRESTLEYIERAKEQLKAVESE